MNRQLDDLQRVLARIMRVILVGSLIGVIVLGGFMLRATWSSTQGERYYVIVGMLFVATVILDRLGKLRGR